MTEPKPSRFESTHASAARRLSPRDVSTLVVRILPVGGGPVKDWSYLDEVFLLLAVNDQLGEYVLMHRGSLAHPEYRFRAPRCETRLLDGWVGLVGDLHLRPGQHDEPNACEEHPE